MPKVLKPEAIEQLRSDGYYFPSPGVSASQATGYRRQLEAFEAANGGALKGANRFKTHLLFKWLADLIRRQCVQIEQAVAYLRTGSDLKKIQEHLVEIHRLENEADTLYLNASAELFRNELGSADIIKWRDIYEQLEQATDSAEHVAHVLEGIVLKHA